MKQKKVNEVIFDLRKLFKIDNKDNHEITGRFLVYKEHFKRKKVTKMLDNYFEKVSIKNGKLIVLKKSLAYSRFNIIQIEKGKKKKEKRKGNVSKAN